VDKVAQEVLQVVYNWFREHGGEWPDFDYIERWLNRYGRPDAVQVIRRLPDTLLKPLNYVDGRPEHGAKMVLLLEGVRQCRGSDDDIYNFIAALRWLVERDRDYDPGSNHAEHMVQIIAEQLANALKLPLASDPKSIRRLMALLKAEGLVLGNECA
jgi:hypothetical protein